ncbi:MAG: hypothetical protein HY874_00430 [Chloroflexi bacterium]|nr:hypothetical protein [Chloroflexota bacterium]
MNRILPLACIAVVLAACGSGAAKTPAASPTLSASAAEARLAKIVLTAADAGPGFTQEVARAQTNEDAANARPDTETARQQYADWGQILAYNVQFGAPPGADLVFNGKTARVMNTATLFHTNDGASAALAYVRGLAPALIANFLVNDGAGTKISETQVVKDIDFPAAGDESFAWRISGKATFAGGFTVNFVADSVFLRAGSLTGNVTAVALGQPPDRAALTALVSTFVQHAKAN